MGAVFCIAQLDGNRVAHPYAHKRARHFVVEGLVFIGAAIREAALDLGGFEIQHHVFWPAVTDRFTYCRGILCDIYCTAFCPFLGVPTMSWPNMPAALWPGSSAEVSKFAGTGRAEYYRGGRAFCRDIAGLRAEFGNSDVVDGAAAIDQIDLDNSAFGHLQIRVDLACHGIGFTDKDQFAVRDVGAQGEGNIRRVSDITAMIVFGGKR